MTMNAAPNLKSRSMRSAISPPPRAYCALLPRLPRRTARAWHPAIHSEFPVRSRVRPSESGEDRGVSVTAVAVSAGSARDEPSPPAAVDPARPAVPTRRWIKWAVGSAIGAGVIYTVVFSASSFADAVGSLAEARFGWAAVGVACEAASFLLLGLLVHRLLGAEAGVSRRATVGVGLVLTGLGNVLPAAPAEGLALASGELHRRGVRTRRVRLALAFSEWYTVRAAFALVAINAVVIAAIVQFRVGGGLARLWLFGIT